MKIEEKINMLSEYHLEACKTAALLNGPGLEKRKANVLEQLKNMEKVTKFILKNIQATIKHIED